MAMAVLAPEWLWTSEGLRTGWAVEVAGGRITSLGPTANYRPDVQLPGRLMIDGLCNAHSHAFQRAFRGHVQWKADGEDDFWSWRDRMYRTANTLDPEGLEAVSRLAFLEMAEAGITRVGEFHYVHHRPDGGAYADPDELAHRVIAAATSVGIRICLLRVAYARSGPGAPLRPDQRRFGDQSAASVLAAVDRLRAVDHPLVQIGLAPHSARAVPRSWLEVLAEFDGVTHAHVSEQPADNRSCIEENGASPVEVFANAGMLHERFTAVHLTHPLPGDLERMFESGAGVCACPGTELDLGDGFLPVEALDLPMCIGSDSHATIEPLAEARALELHARGLAGRRNVLAPAGERHGLAERILRMAGQGGHRALGAEALGIAVGADADLVAIDLRRPAAAGVPPLEAAAFVATPGWVSDVWVAGEQIVREGRHPHRSEVLAAAAPWLHP